MHLTLIHVTPFLSLSLLLLYTTPITANPTSIRTSTSTNTYTYTYNTNSILTYTVTDDDSPPSTRSYTLTGDPTITLTNKLHLALATGIPGAPSGWVVGPRGHAIDPEIFREQKKSEELHSSMMAEDVRMGKTPAPGSGPRELAPAGCKRLRVKNTTCDPKTPLQDCEKIVVCCDWECSNARNAARKAFSDWVDGVFVVEEIDDGGKKVYMDGTVE
ncbi:MAG: hypothetical protein Q9215_005918 [Flavoplaca cf. flavocitrina]